ncbi:MAG: hypothetical protein A3J47_01090 [Candidatus Yanofskybacteria bacterium RIFCSPHIGHO2_02_FULL_43_22]|uniref:Uncharacterized protein n=1 Tax=Candidatus Yanofskybacteria bacterium RIFCSPHIGHO2_02_FULL_43_22 TaxID=1802681 RepID=A0A1F8FPI8_9BACT|nr:MAG: hypothetical protein A3J47_01090 [Candidatus Yanofskybacteria bacterium RIFCSPHIGHO2_02_FULL_43_22]
MSNNKLKLVISSAYASIITIVFVVIITVWAELSMPLKDWLKNFSGHHWTSKSIFSISIYIVATLVLCLLPNKYSDGHIKRSLELVLIVTLLGIVTITLFFTGHHFQIF